MLTASRSSAQLRLRVWLRPVFQDKFRLSACDGKQIFLEFQCNRLEDIAKKLAAIALRLAVIALRLEAIASRLEAIGLKLEAIASRLEAIGLRLEAIASTLEAITLRLEAIALRLKAIGLRLEAIACRLEAIALRLKAIGLRLEAIASRPLLGHLVQDGLGGFFPATNFIDLGLFEHVGHPGATQRAPVRRAPKRGPFFKTVASSY